MACCHHRGGLHECLVRAARPDLTRLTACFGPMQPSTSVSHYRPLLAGLRARTSQVTPARRLTPLPRCESPRPPLTISRTTTTLACVVVAGLWSARRRGAALGRRCRQPAGAAAAGVRALGWYRLARPAAALWRFRSRARPRPLHGSRGRGLLGLGRSAVAPLHVDAAGCRRRIEHLRCWGEAQPCC